MSGQRGSTLVGITVAAVVVIGSDVALAIQTGRLEQIAADARKAGKNREFVPDPVVGFPGIGYLRELSAVIAVASASPPRQTVTSDFIFTWQAFRVEQIPLRRDAMLLTLCGSAQAPPSLKLGGSTIAIPLRRGSASIGGVQLTMQTRDSDIAFEAGKRYLLLGELCPDGVLWLRYGGGNAFSLGKDDRLGSSLLPTDEPIRKFKTVAALMAYLKGLAE